LTSCNATAGGHLGHLRREARVQQHCIVLALLMCLLACSPASGSCTQSSCRTSLGAAGLVAACISCMITHTLSTPRA
jgi:hypothetical protein